MRDAANLYLVGMMGAGKTTVARSLARRLKLEFVDSDHEIEARCGVKIPVIFEIEGEAGFRAREAQAIAELTRRDGIVLATGGGVVLLDENRRLLAARGTVVYLRATPDPLKRLRELYAERDPLYRSIADVVIDTGRQSAQVLARSLLEQLGPRWKASA